MSRRTRSAGFTLLEMLAVVIIIGIVSVGVLPNFGFARSDNLRDDARQLAYSLELARQRTVMTGVPHRVLVDFDTASFWVEVETRVASERRAVASGTLDLAPPPDARIAFEPLDSHYGRETRLRNEAYIREIVTDQGVIEAGQVAVGFDRDGTAELTEIVLEEPGGAAFVVELRPLADAVRVRDA